jgi:hypothetical protein
VASTLTYQPPAIFVNEEFKSPNLRGKFTPAAGHTGTAVINAADFVVLTTGTIARVATNGASILGLARFSETQIFGQPGGSTTANVLPSSLFGWSQAGTLLPSESLQVAVDALTGPIWVEMSLVNTVVWTGDTLLGTRVGLLLDTGTNLYVADNGQANKVGTVMAKVNGPNIFLPSGVVLGKGQINDLGVRVWVQFDAAALQ